LEIKSTFDESISDADNQLQSEHQSSLRETIGRSMF